MNEFTITGPQTTEKKTLARQMRQEMTPQERKLWQHLRAGRLNGLHFRRQQVVDGFIADFYCHAARLIVEADGAIHTGQAEYDAERDAILAARGLKVLRVSNSDVDAKILTVLARIKTAANAHRAVLSPPPCEALQANKGGVAEWSEAGVGTPAMGPTP